MIKKWSRALSKRIINNHDEMKGRAESYFPQQKRKKRAVTLFWAFWGYLLTNGLVPGFWAVSRPAQPMIPILKFSRKKLVHFVQIKFQT